MARMIRLGVAAAVVLALACAAAAPAARRPPLPLRSLHVTNGATPFAGDRRLLTTISPNGDGFRDRAIVTFRLDERATVKLDAVRTDAVKRAGALEQVVWSTTAHLRRGWHSLAWNPSRDTPERTYVLRLTITNGSGAQRVYGAYRPSRRMNVDAPVVRVQGVEAAFLRRSYAPGETADVSVASDASRLRFQVFAFANLSHPTEHDLKTSGVAMTPPVTLDWRAHRSAPHLVRIVRAGEWPSGLYFLRITAGDGRVGYAPFILRPRHLGAAKVAVVLATNTWQAYNFDDADGDGWGDSWYVSGAIRTIDLRRPFLDFGVPFRFRDWDLTVVSWLSTTGKAVDYLSDDDLAHFSNGDELARRYDLVVFPGHEEYVTQHAYDVVARYRNLGGNLLFLSANNFFWKVVRHGPYLTRVAEWRRPPRPGGSPFGGPFAPRRTR